jgi:purine-cytosine permease-like protein
MSEGQHSTLVERLDALYEYDREPVKEKDLHGAKTFIAMFASEHVAGTEFILGPLLVSHGVSAFDAVVGLLFGNILAVLSWALMCAPIAVRERLTVYWQIRKVAGPYLTVLYSAVFAVVLCLLAGAMVSTSTTAIAIPLDIPSPNYDAGDRMPSVAWMVLAALVGTVVALLAVLGFERMAHFAKVCAPWMPFIFLAGALACLPMLGVTGPGNFWEIANDRIWTGVPTGDDIKYGFWHCVGFAWLCNISQHMGMGDVTIFRYAKKWYYGFASAFGMFIGHYLAWLASGIMCAAFLFLERQAGVEKPNVTPGNIAQLGAGWAGLICVVLAGWTTANPTLYRAGLAFQTASPNWRRWKVTLACGIGMIVAACIPAVTKFLDRIVAYYGLFFMPLGAFIFIDYWVFPRLGLRRYHPEFKRLLWSWPAAIGWFGSFGICFLLYAKDQYPAFSGINSVLPGFLVNYKADFFLQVLPAWIIAVTLYIVCSMLQQALSGSAPTESADIRRG